MADNVELNAGAGGATLATDDVAGIQFQRVKVTWGTDGTCTDASASNPLPVVQTGTHTVTGAGGTFPVTDSGGSLTVDNAALSVVGGGVEATAIRVTVASDSTGVLSIDDNGGSLTVDGTVTANLAAGTNNIGDVDILTIAAGDNNIGNVDIVTVPTDPFGANADAASATGSISAKLRFIASTGIPITGTVTVSATNLSCNVAQVAGTATAVNNGTASAGCQRVTIASDNTAFNVNATPKSATSGGLSKFHLVSAATTNATSVKASAGQLYGWYIYNSNASARKVAFHNTAGTPTAGASVTESIVIPGSSAANCFTTLGIAFSTGIAITTVTGLADSDNTAVALNDLVINLYYA